MSPIHHTDDSQCQIDTALSNQNQHEVSQDVQQEVQHSCGKESCGLVDWKLIPISLIVCVLAEIVDQNESIDPSFSPYKEDSIEKCQKDLTTSGKE